MDNVIPMGGKKYESPKNMLERKELYESVRDLSIARFKKFIEQNIPELVTAGWLEKTDEQLTCLLHEIRSQYVGAGEDYINSRNFLKAKQYGYTAEEAAQKPKCMDCKWFRNVPEGETMACMHLGAIPQDISCGGYESI